MNKDIIFNAQFHPNINQYSVLVVDMGNGGTHERYNVIHNSECDLTYYDTQEQALEVGFRAYKEYLKNNDTKRT